MNLTKLILLRRKENVVKIFDSENISINIYQTHVTKDDILFDFPAV